MTTCFYKADEQKRNEQEYREQDTAVYNNFWITKVFNIHKRVRIQIRGMPTQKNKYHINEWIEKPGKSCIP